MNLDFPKFMDELNILNRDHVTTKDVRKQPAADMTISWERKNMVVDVRLNNTL